MSESGDMTAHTPLAALRQFVRRPAAVGQEEFCELCSGALRPDHQHLLELGKRNIVCACDACALLFSSRQTTRYRRIPREIRLLRDFALDDLQWESLLIPINLAFFFYSSAAERVLACYPSPAGATESLLDLEYWESIANGNPAVRRMQPDVEALLVNRIGKPAEYYLAPIDHCYRLAGAIRTHWRGLSGGSEVWRQIDGFFAGLRQLCPKGGGEAPRA